MIRFLKVFWDTFRGDNAKHRAPDSIASNERVTRYILSRKQFSRENKRIKYAAFLPPRDLELSVYRTNRLDGGEIWEIGKRFVAEPQGKTVLARGDLQAATIVEVGLGAAADTQPHKLHANIVGWPAEKSEQKMLAIEFANAASIEFPPT